VPVTLTPSWGSHGIRSWNRTLTIRVSGIALAEGDQLCVLRGDTLSNGPGMRAQTHFYEPGRFVTFHDYEWSGNTPAGGDHNAYYRDDGPLHRRLAHQPAPHDASFVWRDAAPQHGINPYWIWVTQTDGKMAWSTPVYVQWDE
jgi:hypothetical protein